MHEKTASREMVAMACETAEIDTEQIIDNYEGRGFGIALDPRGSSIATAAQLGAALTLQMGVDVAHDDDPSWIDDAHLLISDMRSDHRNFSSVVLYFRGWSLA
jgi:hypothetical protein